MKSKQSKSTIKSQSTWRWLIGGAAVLFLLKSDQARAPKVHHVCSLDQPD